MTESQGHVDTSGLVLTNCKFTPKEISFPWHKLPPELTDRVVSFLSANDVACNVRLINRASADQFQTSQYSTIYLSQPVPAHAFAARWDRPEAVRGLTARQRKELARLTARSGVLANLDVLLSRFGFPLTTSLLAAAASGGHRHVCQYLRHKGCRWSESVHRAAAATGNLDFCRWLLDAGCPFDDRSLAAAAGGGHRELCEWLIGRGCTWRSAVPRAAAEAGHEDLLHWFLALQHSRQLRSNLRWDLHLAGGAAAGPVPVQSRARGEDGLLIASVASGCDLATLKVLHGRLLERRRREPESQADGSGDGDSDDDHGGGDTAGPAGRPGWRRLLPHLEVRVMTAAVCSRTPDWQAKVLWLHAERGYPLSVESWSRVASQADWLDRIRWLRSQGLRPDTRAVLAAVRYGNVEALSYLTTAEADGGGGVDAAALTPILASEAVRYGKVEVLEALYDKGLCLLNATSGGPGGGDAPGGDAVAGPAHMAGGGGAAPGALPPGHLGELGISGVLAQAAAQGRIDAVKWVVSKLDAVVAASSTVATEPGGSAGSKDGDVVLRQYLTVEVATAAAGSGQLEVLRYLRQRGCPWSEATFSAAAEWGSEELLEWMAAAGCPMGTQGEPYWRAARTGDLATLRCLRRLGCPWSPTGHTFTRAVALGCFLPALQWLHGEGCPISWAGAITEARRPWRPESSEVLTWLLEQRRAAGLLARGRSMISGKGWVRPGVATAVAAQSPPAVAAADLPEGAGAGRSVSGRAGGDSGAGEEVPGGGAAGLQQRGGGWGTKAAVALAKVRRFWNWWGS